jgi:endo-1,4-beta-xylanase
MNRRAFLKVGAAATSFLLLPIAAQPEEKDGATGESISGGISERIEKHRKGGGRINVCDSMGNPLKGVKISVEQLRHDFLFGCNFFMFGHCGDPVAEEQYRQKFADVFNYCTLGFYWAAYEHEQGKPNYSYTDQVVEWTRAHSIKCKGHPLVWDHPAGSPAWLPENPQAIRSLSDARLKEIVSRYKGQIDFWDVVNEATHLPDKVNKTKMAKWALEYGPVPYVSNPLKIARAANPEATLLVNDYRTDPPYLRLLEAVRKESATAFDVVGIQSHMHDSAWGDSQTWRVCETYARLGLPLHFTETTLVSGPRNGPGENWGATNAELETKQAEGTENFYKLLFSHPAVQAITWWDFSDRGAWQRAAAGWLRKDMSAKPVYDRMRALIKRDWWTKAQGVTDAEGNYPLHAFFGTHRLSLELPGIRQSTHEVHWQRHSQNVIKLVM